MGEPWPRGLLLPAPAVAPDAAALALYAQLLGASSLRTAAHRLVAALARDFGFERVSIALA